MFIKMKKKEKEEIVRINFLVPMKLKNKFKAHCAKYNVDMTYVVTELIKKEIKK